MDGVPDDIDEDNDAGGRLVVVVAAVEAAMSTWLDDCETGVSLSLSRSLSRSRSLSLSCSLSLSALSNFRRKLTDLPSLACV